VIAAIGSGAISHFEMFVMTCFLRAHGYVELMPDVREG
jgi:hypothetical protein